MEKDYDDIQDWAGETKEIIAITDQLTDFLKKHGQENTATLVQDMKGLDIETRDFLADFIKNYKDIGEKGAEGKTKQDVESQTLNKPIRNAAASIKNVIKDSYREIQDAVKTINNKMMSFWRKQGDKLQEAAQSIGKGMNNTKERVSGNFSKAYNNNAIKYREGMINTNKDVIKSCQKSIRAMESIKKRQNAISTVGISLRAVFAKDPAAYRYGKIAELENKNRFVDRLINNDKKLISELAGNNRKYRDEINQAKVNIQEIDKKLDIIKHSKVEFESKDTKSLQKEIDDMIKQAVANKEVVTVKMSKDKDLVIDGTKVPSHTVTSKDNLTGETELLEGVHTGPIEDGTVVTSKKGSRENVYEAAITETISIDQLEKEFLENQEQSPFDNLDNVINNATKSAKDFNINNTKREMDMTKQAQQAMAGGR